MTFAKLLPAFASFKAWLFQLFSADSKCAEPSGASIAALPIVETATEPISVETPKAQKATSAKPRDMSRQRSLASILENIGTTFENLKRDADSAFSIPVLSKPDRAGLLRLGPLVIDGALNLKEPAAFTKENSQLPATFMVAINDGGNAVGDLCSPDFMFGVKIKKPPWIVAKQQGQAWMFGMAWRTQSGKLVWGYFYAFTSAGQVVPAKWLCEKPVNVGQGSYVRRVWATSSWAEKDADQAVCICMSNAIAAYMRRNESWNVSVTQNGRRATFLIDAKNTAHAFKNREATAIATDGKRKRIIHVVREHTQDRGDKVVTIPSHIRGIREFDWNGYHCFVTSPDHHTFVSSALTLASDDVNAEALEQPGMVGLDKLAELLVDREENSNTKRKAA